jgi:hypothetical protein
MVRDPEHPQLWEPHQLYQVFNTDKPVSMLFDASATIDQGGCGGIGYGYGGLVGKEPIHQ